MKFFLFFVVFPIIGLVLLFGSFIHKSYPHITPTPTSWSCSQDNAQFAPVDGGDQIAPLCGNTPYPTATMQGYGPDSCPMTDIQSC